MEMLGLAFTVVFTLSISCWNAFAGGALWEEARVQGRWFKAVAISAVVLSAGGFLQVNVLFFGRAALGLGSIDQNGFMLLIKIVYVLVVPTFIGFGTIVWLDALARARRDRNFVNSAVAAYDTYALYRNVTDAAEILPGAIGDVADGIGGLTNDKDGAKVLAFFFILTLSAALSFLMARYFWNLGASKREVLLREYVEEHKPA